jgi:formylglycine-generating enzyme required for sulfatase activity
MEAERMEEATVFISYSHDSLEHKRRVLEFANRLRVESIDAVLDQYSQDKPPLNWAAWARRQIERADYVLVVCTEQLCRAFEGDMPKGRRRGAQWEGMLSELTIYMDELNAAGEEGSRFIPVGFCAREEAPIPRILSGTSYYNAGDADNYAVLVKRLKGIPTVTKPPLGAGGSPQALGAGGVSARRPITPPSSAEERYCALLRRELGAIRMLGSPDIPNLPVHTLDVFVHLNVSISWRCDERFAPGGREMSEGIRRDLSPDEVMREAFQNARTLLIIGDPGSGKTTLMKYYAMSCLSDEGCRKLGFEEAPLPIYFPLRETQFGDGGSPGSLAEHLARWAQRYETDVSRDQFERWLKRRRTLLLLDGLDEIRSLDNRRRACKWIAENVKDRALSKVLFVVTSRWTGYRGSDQVELACPHLRADVRDFKEGQQDEFLVNWFTAAFLREPFPAGEDRGEWEAAQKAKGAWHAQQVIDYLDLDRNKAMRDLAAVPLLLQIIAVIWKERGVRPRNRVDLYSAVMRYLLEYRDATRGLEPLFSADQALRVLRPAALWMQEKLQVDEVEKGLLHERMQDKVQSIDHRVSARRLFENLRNRAGILADYSTTAYIFRHKSFREYLAGLEIASQSSTPKQLRRLARYLGDDWWEETLRFFISQVNADQFDGFMKGVFECLRDADLDVNRQRALRVLIEEAGEKKIDSLVACLTAPDKGDGLIRKRCVLDCLKTIDWPVAWDAIRTYSRTGAVGADYAGELIAERPDEQAKPGERPEVERGVAADVFGLRAKSFRNPHELNAEYIRIPGGSFEYSVTKKTEPVPDLYFAKYPVTNQRYRRFIGYLAGRVPEFSRVLPVDSFSQGLLAFASRAEGFKEYLGGDPGRWAEKLTSDCDQEKRFKGDDQQVVAVSWCDASAYCLWLSMLEAAVQGVSVEQSGRTYRLPREVEWEWAAAGREPGGGLREYPWPQEKGEPTDKLANYGQNVGATTPVGRYPEGATPEGLMDMAGNVWEWMENWHKENVHKYRSLRGGSWFVNVSDLRCSARLYVRPVYRDNDVGFRVLCSQS